MIVQKSAFQFLLHYGNQGVVATSGKNISSIQCGNMCLLTIQKMNAFIGAVCHETGEIQEDIIEERTIPFDGHG